MFRLSLSLSLSLSLLLILFVAGQVHASTTVSGIIAGDTWTAAKSPYLVAGNVFVTQLTIESNVTVRFSGNYEFKVGGPLQVNGASNAPVYFLPSSTSVGWKGILFSDAVPGSYFNYAVIQGSKNGGVRITNTPPMFTNCVIRDNTSPGHGGGIFAQVTGETLVLENCLVTNNSAGPTGCSADGWGGGLCVIGSSLISRSTIAGNRINGNGAFGGGLFLRGDSTLRSCKISANRAIAACIDTAGDGIYAYAGVLQMYNCTVVTNGVGGSGPKGGWAAGLYLGANGTTAKILNCIFAGNEGVGIRCNPASASLVNCTVVGNVGYGFYVDGGSGSLTNSIVYNNNPAGGQQLGGAITVAYSDVQGGIQPGTGNISFSPALCPENFSLIQGSPCIDKGSPNTIFNDLCIDPTLCSPYSRGTSRNDMGAYGGPGACACVQCDGAPVILTDPQSQYSCLAHDASFSVGATGSQLEYQWYRNSVPLPGQTNYNLLLKNLQGVNAGLYSVEVYNLYGGVMSAPASLMVLDACADIHMYAGLNIAGQPGRTYVLKYTTDMNNTNFSTWIPLATTNMTSSGWFYIDKDSPSSPTRFYGVKLQ